jgi:hypothetical protein
MYRCSRACSTFSRYFRRLGSQAADRSLAPHNWEFDKGHDRSHTHMGGSFYKNNASLSIVVTKVVTSPHSGLPIISIKHVSAEAKHIQTEVQQVVHTNAGLGR